ncbi:MAG: hypothetical protein GC166_10840 [Alphaproteobacteria bacterium]|nr:hypothetical protein [Alphaproteobacteria bacterium]
MPGRNTVACAVVSALFAVSTAIGSTAFGQYAGKVDSPAVAKDYAGKPGTPDKPGVPKNPGMPEKPVVPAKTDSPKATPFPGTQNPIPQYGKVDSPVAKVSTVKSVIPERSESPRALPIPGTQVTIKDQMTGIETKASVRSDGTIPLPYVDGHAKRSEIFVWTDGHAHARSYQISIPTAALTRALGVSGTSPGTPVKQETLIEFWFVMCMIGPCWPFESFESTVATPLNPANPVTTLNFTMPAKCPWGAKECSAPHDYALWVVAQPSSRSQDKSRARAPKGHWICERNPASSQTCTPVFHPNGN